MLSTPDCPFWGTEAPGCSDVPRCWMMERKRKALRPVFGHPHARHDRRFFYLSLSGHMVSILAIPIIPNQRSRRRQDEKALRQEVGKSHAGEQSDGQSMPRGGSRPPCAGGRAFFERLKNGLPCKKQDSRPAVLPKMIVLLLSIMKKRYAASCLPRECFAPIASFETE